MVANANLLAEASANVAGEALDQVVCTAAQQRWWFLDQLLQGDSSLNVAFCWELSGRFSKESIERAFSAVIARHEILRTRFVNDDGEPRQEPLRQADFALEIVELSDGTVREREARLAEVSKAFVRKPFDLTVAPLIRAQLVHTGPRRAMLNIVAHHIVFDGWSIRILGRELGALIDGFERGARPELPELPLQYADYALWMAECQAQGAFEQDVQFWIERLKDLPYFELEPDFEPQDGASSDAGIATALLSSDRSRAFTEFAKAHGVTTFALGSAIIAETLRDAAGTQGPVALMTQVAGRSDVDLEGLIGLFINTVVLRYDSSGEDTPLELVKRSRDTVHEAVAHAGAPFDEVVRRLNPPRRPGRPPLVSINTIIQDAFFEDADYGDLRLRGVPSPTPGAAYDLNFQMIRRRDGWRLNLEYNSDLFRRETAEALLARWVSTLETFLDAPGEPLRQAAAAAAAVQPSQQSPGLRTLEEQVGAIWSEVLGANEIGPQSNFFELGGHSLLAVRMLVKVSKLTGERPKLAHLIKAPTLREFVSAVASGTPLASELDAGGRAAQMTPAVRGTPPAETWDVMELASGPDSPVICSVNHPLMYYQLAERLDGRFRLLNAHIDSLPTVAGTAPQFCEIAERAVEALRRVAPHGPYVLIGLCVNGPLALEMARLLQSSGEVVELVAMVDAWSPGAKQGSPAFTAPLRRLRVRVRRLLHYVFELASGRISFAQFAQKYDWARRFATRVLGLQVGSERVESAPVTDYLVASSPSCRLTPYKGQVMLLRSDSALPDALRRQFGWTGVIDKAAATVTVRGWHEDAFTGEGLDTLADAIESTLAARVSPSA